MWREAPHRRACLGLFAVALGACSLRAAAASGLADVFASEEDPELARDALPFALKATEALGPSSSSR